MQQNSEHFEEGVVRAIQMAWSTFDEWKCVRVPYYFPVDSC